MTRMNLLLLQNLILIADIFNGRIAQANLITKAEFGSRLWSLIGKVTTNKSKHLLVEMN